MQICSGFDLNRFDLYNAARTHMLETEAIYKRAEQLHVALEIRPEEEQDAIWQEALSIAEGSTAGANFVLRRYLYTVVGGNLWNESLHVDEPRSLEPFEEVIEGIRALQFPLSEDEAFDMMRHADGRTKGHPWDSDLYAAFIFDFLGQRYFEQFIGLSEIPEEQKSEALQFYGRARELYYQTAGKSIYEWNADLVKHRVTDLVNYFALSTASPDSPILTDSFVRRNFSEEVKNILLVAAAHHLFSDNNTSIAVSGHFIGEVPTIPTLIVETMTYVGALSNEQMRDAYHASELPNGEE